MYRRSTIVGQYQGRKWSKLRTVKERPSHPPPCRMHRLHVPTLSSGPWRHTFFPSPPLPSSGSLSRCLTPSLTGLLYGHTRGMCLASANPTVCWCASHSFTCTCLYVHWIVVRAPLKRTLKLNENGSSQAAASSYELCNIIHSCGSIKYELCDRGSLTMATPWAACYYVVTPTIGNVHASTQILTHRHNQTFTYSTYCVAFGWCGRTRKGSLTLRRSWIWPGFEWGRWRQSSCV